MAKKKSKSAPAKRKRMSQSEVVYTSPPPPPPQRSMTQMFFYLLLAAALVAGVFFLLKNQGTGLGITTLFPTTASSGTTIAPLGGGGGLSTIVIVVLAVVGFVFVVLGLVTFQKRNNIMGKSDLRVLDDKLAEIKKKNEAFGRDAEEYMAKLQNHWRGLEGKEDGVILKESDAAGIERGMRYLMGNNVFDALKSITYRDMENGLPPRYKMPSKK